MTSPKLYGAGYSVYTRIARLAMEEKCVSYKFEEIDIFSDDPNVKKEYLKTHPFGKIPVLKHDGQTIFEAQAITRYIDQSFEGAPLQPEDAQSAAHMNQIIGICDSYAYRAMVWDVYVERGKAQDEKPVDEDRISGGMCMARICLDVFRELKGDTAWLAGHELSLADIHVAPIVALFQLTEDGSRLLDAYPALKDWWKHMNARPTMRATRYPVEV